MRGLAQTILDLGAELTLLGTGTPEQGRGFSERTRNPFRLLVDPQLIGYRALELKSRLYGGFRPQTVPRFFGALWRGFRPRGTQGDPHQLGGVFIITPLSELAYSYLSKSLDDRADPRVVLDVLRSLAAKS